MGLKQSYDRSLFRVGAACRRDFAAALPSSPALAASALPLASWVFDLAASDDFCLPPAAVSPELAESVLPLAFCFLASIWSVFDFGAGDGLGRPAASALELAKFFGRSTGNRIDLPVALAPLTKFALPLPFRFPTSSTAIFVFGRGGGFCWPVALAPPLAELALPLPSCFPTSSAAIFGFGNGNGGSRPATAISSSRGSSITKRPGWRMRPAMRPASSPAPQ